MIHNNQTGQSVIEFAVCVTVLLAFLIGIPIVAKIANINIMSIQALDYAAWRVREGNTDNKMLTTEIKDRYFGESALIVDNEQISNLGANLGRGKDGQKIYDRDGIVVQYHAEKSHNKIRFRNGYKFPLDDKSGKVSISVPLQNLDVLPEIVSNMTISNNLYIDNQSLTSLDDEHTKSSLRNMSSTIVPYNSKAQRLDAKIINSIMPLWSKITSEHNISDIDVSEKSIPKDRLAEYKP